MITHETYLKKSKEVCYREDGYVNNWFSNMLPLDEPLSHNGIKYFTVENFYQAMKIADHRHDLRVEIAAMDPHASKACFRKYPDKFLIRDDWATGRKLRMMQYALNLKFHGDGPNPATSWHTMLIATGDEPIIEFNNWGDTFWGWDIRKQRGSNHLGNMLMDIRDRYTQVDLDDFMA